MKPDLYTTPVHVSEIKRFISFVTDQAITDHSTGRKSGRSGDWLCDEYTFQCRRGHKRMASSLYRKIRWTLDTRFDG